MGTDRRVSPDILVDDPGAWSIVSFVREAQGAQIMGRSGRRKLTSAGLLSDIVPDVPIERPGLDPSLDTVGAGLIRLVAVSREGARRLYIADAGKHARLFGLAFLRLPERTLVRFIGGAACAAWTEDGSLLAIGGDWGVMLAEGADSPT